MVEGGALEISEDELLGAIKTAQKTITQIIELQENLQELCGKEKKSFSPPPIDPELEEKVRGEATKQVKEALLFREKSERSDKMNEIRNTLIKKLADDYSESEVMIHQFVDDIEKEEMRRMILEENKRVDGRGLDEIRPITCEVGVLPRTHGSALFTRGQTQALAVVTLGTSSDEQRIDSIEGESSKAFMLHYNFPPFSVGEVRMIRGPARREIGHGALAERALKATIPHESVFPYTIRIVADILESNGSSSMATVCSGSLSLMDAGTPIKAAVAGIAIGLVKEGDKVSVLTDILGDEDHIGDMDFKVSGTREGITAFQMDIKIEGISYNIMEDALKNAREARLNILDTMNKTITEPRDKLSTYAPRIITMTIRKDRIGDIIGPGGKVIRGIIEETGAKIEVEDDGSLVIASVDQEAGEKAMEMIKKIIEEPEVGKLYHGTVKNILAFGAFVEILPRVEGLVHISEVDHKRIERVEDILKVGEKVWVKLIGIDDQKRIKLSRKAALDEMSRKKGREQNDSRST
jgi:polyribonucleotide nucleotidyltransferase